MQNNQPSGHNQQPLLISAKALAELLSVSIRTIRRLCQQNKLPSPVRIGRSPRWSLDVILRWIEEGCPPLDEFNNS